MATEPQAIDLTNINPNCWSTQGARNRKGASAFLYAMRSGWTMYFPHLPEQIALPRSANFSVKKIPTAPDGLPVYLYTEPMELSLSFKVHAFDDYCPNGPMTLVDMAAKLTSLLMPENIIAKGFQTRFLRGNPNAITNAYRDNDSLMASGNYAEYDRAIKKDGKTETESVKVGVLYPEPVLLRIMMTGVNTLGIHFQGYVSRVNPILKGPWLTPINDTASNLPSSAQYDITVVHSPGYYGTATPMVIGYTASDIAGVFYNTKLNSANGVKLLTVA